MPIMRKNVPIDLKRKRIENPNGTFSTEKTITIEADGKYFNIPTIIDGKEVSKENAIQRFRDSKQHMGVYGSQEEAISEAKKRSQRIGQIRKGW